MGYGYEPVEWQDHVTEFPGRREIEQVGENLVMLKKAEGRTIQQGTPRFNLFQRMQDPCSDFRHGSLL